MQQKIIILYFLKEKKWPLICKTLINAIILNDAFGIDVSLNSLIMKCT